MKFGSVCSGIEAASMAWNDLGIEAAWLAEIEPFPSAVLAHHHPTVPNLGDMTQIHSMVTHGFVDAPDILVGGTPCQAFSLAGLRGGLSDSRGGLTLKFVELADAIDEKRVLDGQQPAIIVWENVPGVLSSNDNAFGCFLAALAEEDDPLEPAGEKWTNAGVVYGPKRTIAWRVLDAQYFGVPQRRRRVFLVASAREGFNPESVLFEFDGMRRDIAPSREAGEEIAPTIRAGSANGGPGKGARSGDSKDELITVHGTQDPDVLIDLAHTQGRNHGQENVVGYRMQAFGEYVGDETASTMKMRDYKDATDLVALNVSLRGREGGATAELGDDIGGTIRASSGGDKPHVLCYSTKLHNTSSNGSGKIYKECTVSLDRSSPPPALLTPMQVRRLTPVECERLQGFPDGYTDIPYGKRGTDGHRYKALGNSMAVPCMRWIGRRLLTELAITNKLSASL